VTDLRARVMDTARATRSTSGSAVVREHQDRLRPGLFLHSGGTLWRHWREPASDHVRITKGQRRAAGYGSAGRRRVVTMLHRLVSLMAAGFVWVKPHGGPYRFPLAIAASDGGCVLVDPRRGHVARTYGSGPIPREQVRLRARWSAHVASPSFEVSNDGRLLLEEYVHGEHIGSLSVPRQTEVVRRVHRAYAGLVAAEGEGSSREFLEPLLRPAVLSRLPTPLQEHLGHPALAALSDSWPMVPTARSCDERNVIISNRVMPVFIDSIPLDLQPFFSVPVGVITSWARTAPHLRHTYFAGGFDRELATLFTSAGAEYIPSPAFRQMLVAVSLISRAAIFVRLSTRGDDTAFVRESAVRVASYGLDRQEAWYGRSTEHHPEASASGGPTDLIG
jgi:hypothetical protein